MFIIKHIIKQPIFFLLIDIQYNVGKDLYFTVFISFTTLRKPTPVLNIDGIQQNCMILKTNKPRQVAKIFCNKVHLREPSLCGKIVNSDSSLIFNKKIHRSL